MFPVSGNFGGLWYTTWQLYAVEIIQITLESAWIYEIHHFQLKCVSIYRKEVKIIAITYFLATLPIMATKIAITYRLGTSCIRLALKFCVFWCI